MLFEKLIKLILSIVNNPFFKSLIVQQENQIINSYKLIKKK